MKELLILRHGKSDWSRGVSDYERPLNERGRTETMRIGTWLKSASKVPELVLASSAARARETAEIACREMHLPEAGIVFADGLYLASLEKLLDHLVDINANVGRLLLVGHNPGLESLLVQLAGASLRLAEGTNKVLPTATVAGLSMRGEWRQIGAAECRLDYIRRGRLL